jgi:O-antigen/teichoic acid export membrane protein
MFSGLKALFTNWFPLRRGGFFSNVAVLTGGSAVSQALMILASPVITRLYSPSHYGAWSLLLSVFVILSVIVCWRYEFAIVLPKEDDEAANIFALTLLLTIGMTVLTASSIWLFGSSLARLVGIEEYATWLWCIPVLLFVFGIYQSSNYWCTRTQEFTRLAASRIGQSAGIVSTQIGTGILLGSSPAGLIMGRVVGQLIGASLLWRRIIRQDIKVYINSLSWASMKKCLYTHKNFPLYVAPYAFLSGFHNRAIYLLLGAFATVEVVGWFALAMRLMYLPIGLISTSINQVFYQKAATEPKFSELEPFVLRILRLMVILVTPLLPFLLLSSHWVFGLVFGEVWAEAGIYGILMAFPAFMMLLTSWLDKIYYVLERQRLAIMLEISYDIISISFFLLAIITLKRPEFAVGCYALITVIYNIIWLIVTFNISGFGKKGILDIGLTFLVVFICSGASYFILDIIFKVVIATILYSIILLCVYVWFFVKFREKWGSYYDNERGVEEVLAG